MTEGFWRVYRTEWSVAYVSDANGEDGKQECIDVLGSGFDASVWRIVPWSESNPEGWPWMLEAHLPVMKGEFTGEQDALDWSTEIGGAVAREGSREDKQMQRYQAAVRKTPRQLSG